MGFSPEQYYHALLAFADGFRPHFVVVSIFTNDLGDLHEVATKDQGDWEEGKYWLDKIVDYCRFHRWSHVIVPVTYGPSMFSRRRSGFYPGKIANILDDSGLMFLNPTDSFINAHLENFVAAEQHGDHPQGCCLFNEAIGDGHFSPVGSEVWARSVGRRLILLMRKDHVMPKPSARSNEEIAMDPATARTAPPPAPPARAGLRREDPAA